MKKNLATLFLLAFSMLSLGQSSLDSLKLIIPEDISSRFYDVTIDTVNNLIIEHRQGGDYFYDFKSLKRISSFYKDGFFLNERVSILFRGLIFFDKNNLFYLKNGKWRISKSDREIINSIKPNKKIIYEQEDTLTIIYDKNVIKMSNPGEFIGELQRKNSLSLKIRFKLSFG